MLYWLGVRLRWLDICIFIDPAFLLQGCALRKIEGSPVFWTCEIQCAQEMISMKKQRFSSRPRTKVRRHGPQNIALSWSIKMQKWMRRIFSHLKWTSLVNKWFITWPRRERLLAGQMREILSGQNGPMHLACLGSQLEYKVRFILPTRGSSWTVFAFSVEVVFQD